MVDLIFESEADELHLRHVGPGLWVVNEVSGATSMPRIRQLAEFRTRQKAVDTLVEAGFRMGRIEGNYGLIFPRREDGDVE